MSNADFSKVCPCGSALFFAKCCQPYHEGGNVAPTAEALLRSRYSAFVTGAVDYILDTHHPETRDQIKREEVLDWSKNSEWLSLTIHTVERGTKNDDDGVIDFTARYGQGGRSVDHREKSEFRKKDGVWYFYDVYKAKPIRHETPPIGRNDPCPCGSGKKFKKCCAV